jgi:hypothetical protein
LRTILTQSQKVIRWLPFRIKRCTKRQAISLSTRSSQLIWIPVVLLRLMHNNTFPPRKFIELNKTIRKNKTRSQDKHRQKISKGTVQYGWVLCAKWVSRFLIVRVSKSTFSFPILPQEIKPSKWWLQSKAYLKTLNIRLIREQVLKEVKVKRLVWPYGDNKL